MISWLNLPKNTNKYQTSHDQYVYWYPLYLDVDRLLPSNSVLKTNRQPWKWSQNLLSGPNFHTLKLHSAWPHHSPSPPECWEPSASGFQNTSRTGPCFRQDECIISFRHIIRSLMADLELSVHDRVTVLLWYLQTRRAYYQFCLSPPSKEPLRIWCLSSLPLRGFVSLLSCGLSLSLPYHYCLFETVVWRFLTCLSCVGLYYIKWKVLYLVYH